MSLISLLILTNFLNPYFEHVESIPLSDEAELGGLFMDIQIFQNGNMVVSNLLKDYLEFFHSDGRHLKQVKLSDCHPGYKHHGSWKVSVDEDDRYIMILNYFPSGMILSNTGECLGIITNDDIAKSIQAVASRDHILLATGGRVRRPEDQVYHLEVFSRETMQHKKSFYYDEEFSDLMLSAMYRSKINHHDEKFYLTQFTRPEIQVFDEANDFKHKTFLLNTTYFREFESKSNERLAPDFQQHLRNQRDYFRNKPILSGVLPVGDYLVGQFSFHYNDPPNNQQTGIVILDKSGNQLHDSDIILQKSDLFVGNNYFITSHEQYLYSLFYEEDSQSSRLNPILNVYRLRTELFEGD